MNPTEQMIAPADVQAAADEATRAALLFVEQHKVAVVDLDSLQRAVRVRTEIAARQATIVEKLAKPKSWAHGLHKWFCGLENAALAPYAALDDFERGQIREFKISEDRARQQREQALADQRKRDDEERATREAAALEASGDHATAAAVVAEAIAAPAPVIVLRDEVKDIAKFRRVWKWRLKNDALVPRAFLAVDTPKLNKYATAMQDSASVEGIEFFYEDVPIR